jgi:LmbE family N-acetylglucosaminyl deacetylase
MADDAVLIGTPATRFALEKLNVLGSVLMIGAHPDDEDNAVLAYLGRGVKAHTGYLSLTRGEGGQNLLGEEQGPLLGVLRSQELLAARRDDGGQQYFSRAIDFGFTNSLEETLTNWGHDKILSDIVWVIRSTQPDVIILCFSGTPQDGHGNHQASAVLGKEAYEAAGNPSAFPEQLKWVKPWQARRLMRRRFTPQQIQAIAGVQGVGNAAPPVAGAAAPGAGRGGRGGGRGGAQPGAAPAGPGRQDAFPNQPTIPVDVGAFDPVIGRSYREIGVISRSEHRSQGQGALLQYGDAQNLLALVEGDIPQKTMFDGVDTTWNRVPGGGSRAGEILARAAQEFDDLHPERTVTALLEARPIVAGLARDGQLWAQWKLEELDEAIALCAGLHIEAQTDAPAYTPGSTAKLTLTALNRSQLPIILNGMHLSGWGDANAVPKNKELANNRSEVTSVAMTINEKQPYSQPFWLAKPQDGWTYAIDDQALRGRADIVPEVTARFDFALGDKPFSVTQPIHYRYADPARGEVIRPVVVEPPVAIDLPGESFVMPLGAPRDMSVQIHALVANQTGEVRIETPAGWKVQPPSVPFELKEAGAAKAMTFRLTPPATSQSGTFKVIAKANGVDVATGIDLIPYAHIPEQTVLIPSQEKLAAVNVKTLAHRVGYVMGSLDKTPESLRQMGCEVDLLDEKDLKSGNLAAYDAIITGLRAYALRADLRANEQRLLDYVKAGGTLIVQYNRNVDRRMSPSVNEALDHLGPYPFTFGDNDARVTQEDAAVKMVDPKSVLLNVPNKITMEDFDGWVQERGLYFATKWDPQYQTVIESHDKGDKDQPGGILYTRLGKGAYIFTAYSWNRELPAGVPGAIRIFANLISAGKAAK